MCLLTQARDANDLSKKESLYYFIINDSSSKDQEVAIMELAALYKKSNDYPSLYNLLSSSRTVLGSFAKSKTAKVIRLLIGMFDVDELDGETIGETLGDSAVSGGSESKTSTSETDSSASSLQLKATRESISWAIDSKLSFLRQALQLKLAELLYAKKSNIEALKLINDLLTEYKKLDDKSSLVEVQLLESKIYYAINNLPKSKAALNSARTSANSIYCPTALQADLDCQSGIVNARENDYKTAFSYFYESFESYHSLNNKKAIKTLKYMLLTKIMLNLIDDVNNILINKNVQNYQSKDIDAMKSIALAYSNRSLKEFESALITHSKELESDEVIKLHFNSLYDNLLQQNLLKIIESYTCVELSHISKIVGLSLQQVEGKLSQMILDKVFFGVLDQGNGWLIIYDQPKKDPAYESSIELIKNLSNVVDLLYQKASLLN